MLSAGYCDELTDVVESGELLEAMAALGLDIRQLHLGPGGEQRAGEKRREVRVNLQKIFSAKLKIFSDKLKIFSILLNIFSINLR